jgi:hypothetical protein
VRVFVVSCNATPRPDSEGAQHAYSNLVLWMIVYIILQATVIILDEQRLVDVGDGGGGSGGCCWCCW